MRINAIMETMKYNEHSGFNDKSKHNGKQNNDENVPFSEILKEAKGDLYLQNNAKIVNQLLTYDT